MTDFPATFLDLALMAYEAQKLACYETGKKFRTIVILGYSTAQELIKTDPNFPSYVINGNFMDVNLPKSKTRETPPGCDFLAKVEGFEIFRARESISSIIVQVDRSTIQCP